MLQRGNKYITYIFYFVKRGIILYKITKFHFVNNLMKFKCFVQNLALISS